MDTTVFLKFFILVTEKKKKKEQSKELACIVSQWQRQTKMWQNGRSKPRKKIEKPIRDAAFLQPVEAYACCMCFMEHISPLIFSALLSRSSCWRVWPLLRVLFSRHPCQSESGAFPNSRRVEVVVVAAVCFGVSLASLRHVLAWLRECTCCWVYAKRALIEGKEDLFVQLLLQFRPGLSCTH